jgi:phytoene dehydrogenase-like protein
VPLRFFDVVVLGMRPGALACAALLARRDFRVLVVGDGHLPSTYRFEGVPLRRRAFAHLAAPSPAYRRVLAELAQSQAFRRRLRPLDPMFQVLDRTFRLDVPPDPALFARELDRELPSVRPPVEQLYDGLAKLNAQIDSVLEQDAVWPPGTFWERRETKRLAAMLPSVSTPFPVDPAYRRVIEIGARFGSNLASGPLEPLPPIATARLHGAWTRGTLELPGDEDTLTEMFVERIRAHGGDVRERERCEAILHQRGKVRAVVLESDGEETGCGFVIGDRTASRLLDRVRELPDGLLPHPAMVGLRRFVVSLVVRRALVPPPLGKHAFLRALREGGLDVHLQRASFIGADPGLTAQDAELWVCEALLDDAWLPRPGDLRAREAVMATVRDHFPFVDREALVIDSPHDGAPLFSRLGAEELTAVPRSLLRANGGSVHAELAEPLFRPFPGAFADIAAEPIRTPLDNLLTIGPSVVPALGTEGELLAAWGAARLVTRTDRKREKMRRELWSKIEI